MITDRLHTRTIRVLIADAHAMLRSGLALFIQTCPDLMLAGEAGTADETLVECERVQPDVVLVDVMTPEMDGITSIRLIHEQFAEMRIPRCPVTSTRIW
jgi:NarL family two-component system response regulator LiaR